MKMSNLLVAAGLVAVASAATAQTVAIPGLINTGSSSSTSYVAGAPGTQGVNYKLTTTGTAPLAACPTGTAGGGNCAFITNNTLFPMFNWLQNNATSQWITPTSNQGQSFDPSTDGIYTYTLSFNLAGFFSNTASFTGRFLSDNSATVRLNGGSVLGTTNGFTAGDWGSFTSGAAGVGFLPGINTLTFTSTNTALAVGNPTGLRVEFTSSQVTAVPEPGALVLMIAGLAMVGGLAKRRLSAHA